MLRMKIAGGLLTAAQMRGLAEMAQQWGCGRVDLTTRANVQLRELAPKDVVNVLNAIQRLGMRAHGSGADNIRNITASPVSGYDPQELIDVQPFADALQNYISNSRDMFGLPRKFNIAFDNGGTIACRNASRLRRTVCHDSPAWKPSSISVSQSWRLSFTARPHSLS